MAIETAESLKETVQLATLSNNSVKSIIDVSEEQAKSIASLENSMDMISKVVKENQAAVSDNAEISKNLDRESKSMVALSLNNQPE